MRQERFFSSPNMRGITFESIASRRISSRSRHTANCIRRRDAGHPVKDTSGRWGKGVAKRINQECFHPLTFVGRFSLWLCVRRLSLFLSRRLRHVHTMAFGGSLTPTRPAVTRDVTSPITTLATWRDGRAGITASPINDCTRSPTAMPASGRMKSPATQRCRAVRRTSSARLAVTSAATRPVAPACGALAS